MEELLHQPELPACPPQVRPFPLRLACLVLLLVLLAGGLGLMVRTPVQDRPLPGPREDPVARLAREYQSGNPLPSPTGSLQQVLAQPDLIPSHHHPLVGRQAPDFELSDSTGKVCSLRELLAGGPLVVIFYLGYGCDHCVRQLFDVNRDLPLFRAVRRPGGGHQCRLPGADAPTV